MKLPRYTAKVPSRMRKSGQTRATNIESLTNTGEQAVHRADQTKWGAIGDIGKSLDYASELAYRSHQHRHAIETNQQVTDYLVKRDTFVEELNRDIIEGALVRSEAERDALEQKYMAAIDKYEKSARKEVATLGNEDTLIELDKDTPVSRLAYNKIVRSALNGKFHQFQVNNCYIDAEMYVNSGQVEKAKEWLDFHVAHGLIGRIQADTFIKGKILDFWQNKVAENPFEAEFELKEELSARQDGKGTILTDDLSSESIQSLLNTASNRKIQIRNQSEEAFNNRKGDATETLAQTLLKGELLEKDIDAIDLQAIGSQKEDEFKWKQEWKEILRKTIKLSEPIVSNEKVYESLVTGSELVERGAKSPAEWEQEYAQAWADGKLEKEDRRSLRSKDIVATKAMQNRAFSDAVSNTMPRLVELRDDELTGLVSARDNAVKLKDLKTVSALNFSIKKAQIQKWNFGLFRKELREQISQNENWSQKQIFVAEEILANVHDKPIAELMLEFESANPQESIIKTPPSDEFNDIWKDLTPEDKVKVWELRMLGVSTKEIIGELP